jgi:flavin-dependent dehydrogenase
MKSDVCIIGAGPAGAFTAYLLAKQGLNVHVLEAQAQVKRKICGEYLCPLGVELLKQHGLENIVHAYPPVVGMKIVSHRGVMLNTYFPEKEAKEMHGMSVNRRKFDSQFIELAEEAGAKFFFDESVRSLEYKNDMWSIKTASSEFSSTLMIGADGRRSFVAQTLGLSRGLATKRIALHSYIQTQNSGRQGEMHLFSDGSYVGLDPIDEQEMNLSLVCNSYEVLDRKGKSNVLQSYLEQSENLSQRFLPLDPDLKIYAITPLKHQVSRSIFPAGALVGDAGGFIDPLTGEGMYNALLTAQMLSATILQSKDNLAQVNFRQYEKKKNRFFRQKVILNTFFQWLIRQPYITDQVATFLDKDQRRRDIFVGIIGNLFTPFQGALKLLKTVFTEGKSYETSSLSR